MQRIEIFRTGEHTDIGGTPRSFAGADLEAIATGYDPSLHEAPLVIGHPQTDDPAFGWVQHLRVEGDRLVAEPHQVPAAFGEAVRSGAYKKVSAAFYAPTDRHNPTPGRWYLRHVGFLGAQPPAIKGLASVAFAEGDTLSQAIVIETAPAPAPVPVAPIPPHPEPEDPAVTPEEAAALRAQNEALQRQLDAAHQREAAAAQAARHAEHVAFAEGVIGEARLPEAWKDPLVAIAGVLDPATAEPVMFSEGSTREPLYERFKRLLRALPPQVTPGEQATRARAAEGTAPVAYAEGANPGREALDRRIRAHMQAHGCSYATAYAAVAR